jgi:peptidoglycan/LPS O-acetylase OafA/YrhL
VNRETSIYLDIIRPVAAFVVLLSHVSYPNLLGQLNGMSGSGIQAVSVFFVLSGFVIAHVCQGRERDALSYFTSRALRIYSVALPAIVATICFDFIGIRADPSVYAGPFQAIGPGLILRSVSFTGEQWWAHRFPGSDGPYWSLGFEVWYYVAFGAIIFAPKRWRVVLAALVLFFVGPKVAILFPLWLLGVVLYKNCIPVSKIEHRLFGWLLYVFSLAAIVIYQYAPQPAAQAFVNITAEGYVWGVFQNYFIGAIFFTHITGFVIVSRTGALSRLLCSIEPVVRWIAGATFSIYLLHLPILYFLVAVLQFPKYETVDTVGLIAVTVTLCFCFAELFERRKHFWAGVTRQMLGIASPARSPTT